MAAFDFPNGSLLITEAGSKKRASLHFVQGRIHLEPFNPGGLEVLGASLEAFRKILLSENHTLKRSLTDWRDRRKSKGHVGIPLISASFVEAIPMISRLLKELGVPMTWVDSHDSEIIAKTMDPSGGLFFVDNAAEATDHQGRKVIAAQDFVSTYGVKSVFGAGGVYPGGQIVVIVVFCRDAFAKTAAERFLELNSWFRNKTDSLAQSTKIFAEA